MFGVENGSVCCCACAPTLSAPRQRHASATVRPHATDEDTNPLLLIGSPFLRRHRSRCPVQRSDDPPPELTKGARIDYNVRTRRRPASRRTSSACSAVRVSPSETIAVSGGNSGATQLRV